MAANWQLPASYPFSLFLILTSTQLANPQRLWNKLYMDVETDCRFIHNDDLMEGDFYMVKSDSWDGGSPWAERRPAECAVNFNYGDRLVVVRLNKRWCDEDFKDPFLAISDNCEGKRENILAYYNCTYQGPVEIFSSSSCVSLYHYRGHTRSGYFFSFQIIAGDEVIAFPAGGIAAIIIASIVGVLVIAKFVCCVTGCENRIPTLKLDPEDQKRILTEMNNTQLEKNGGNNGKIDVGLEVNEAAPHHGAVSDREEQLERRTRPILKKQASLSGSSPPTAASSPRHMTSGFAPSSRSCENLDIPAPPPRPVRYGGTGSTGNLSSSCTTKSLRVCRV